MKYDTNTRVSDFHPGNLRAAYHTSDQSSIRIYIEQVGRSFVLISFDKALYCTNAMTSASYKEIWTLFCEMVQKDLSIRDDGQ